MTRFLPNSNNCCEAGCLSIDTKPPPQVLSVYYFPRRKQLHHLCTPLQLALPPMPVHTALLKG